MKIYSRYITFNILKSTLVVTLIITSIAWLIQTIRFLDLIVNKGLGIKTFAYLSALILPSLLFIILPIALFCAVLHTYNKLNDDSELIILKGAGLGPRQLAIPAFVVTIFVVAFEYFLSLYLLPLAHGQFKEIQDDVRNNYFSLLLQEGVFNSPAKGITVYIDSRDKSGLLKGIIVHDERNLDNVVTIMAEEAKLSKTSSGLKFELVHGNRQEISSKDGNLSVLYFDNYPVDLSFYTDKRKERFRSPEEYYITELFFNNYDKAQENLLLAEGHYRLAWPLQSFALTMLAVAALFSSQFNRGGQWKRILIASAIGVLSVSTSFWLKGAMVLNPFIYPILYLHIIVLVMIAWYVLLREEGGR